MLFLSQTKAQCYPLVSPGGMFVSNGGLDSVLPVQFEPQPFVVCHNARLYYYGNNPDTVYLENSAQLTVGLSFNLVVYMKAGSFLQIDTSQSGMKHFKEIIYDPGTSLFYDTTGIMVANGLSPCPGLIYDYSSFPGNNWPCFGTAPTSIHEPDLEAALDILTNPLEGSATIRWKGSLQAPIHLSLYALNGQLLESWEMLEAEQHISLKGHAAGTYLIRVEREGQYISRKLLNY